MKKINLHGHEIFMVKGSYEANGATAISVFSEEDGFLESFGVLTVCIPEVPAPSGNKVIVKTWSENEIFSELIDLGIFKNTGETIPTGYVFAEVWEIADESYLMSDKEFEEYQNRELSLS